MSGFLVIPAVDIKSGRCVRLFQGRPEEETVFSNDPLEMAESWEKQGARLLHLVDLDGALTGKPVHRDLIGDIARNLSVPVQVGGGIRELEIAEWYLDAGVSRVILGTAAMEGDLLRELAQSYPEKVVLGLDVRKGSVAVKGWKSTVDLAPLEVAMKAMEAGVDRLIYTNVGRDGTLEGPDLIGLKELARGTRLKVIASGGISSLEDVGRVSELKSLGVEGVIVGMALYEGRFQLREAIEMVSKKE